MPRPKREDEQTQFPGGRIPFYVYILKCANGAFYVGYTSDLDKRIVDHNAGRGSTYTRRNGPVTLVYSESLPSEIEAMRREAQLKRWSRAKKQALIDGNLSDLHQLARRRKHYPIGGFPGELATPQFLTDTAANVD